MFVQMLLHKREIHKEMTNQDTQGISKTSQNDFKKKAMKKKKRWWRSRNGRRIERVREGSEAKIIFKKDKKNFSRFSFYLSSFRVSSKNCRCCWTQLSKKYHWFSLEKLLLEKNPCFRDFDIFLLLICFFFMHDLQFFLFLSFSCKYLVSFCLYLFVSVQKKKHLEKQIDPLYFCVYSPCSYSSWVALSRRFYSLFFLRAFCPFLSLHVSSSHVQLLFLRLFVLSDVSSVCVYSFFLTLFIPFFKTFFSNSFVSSFFFWFFNLVLSNKDLSLFYEKSLKTLNFWEKLFSFLFAKKKKCHRNCWRNKQFCPDLICGNLHVFWKSIKMSSLFRKVFF